MRSKSERPTSFGKSPPRVLVVDDDAGLRVALCRALERTGCIALAARNVGEALAMCETRPLLDLVIVDLQLPDGRGEQLVADLTKLYADAAPKFVLMTGHSLPGPVGTNVAALLEKPFSTTTFVQVVHDALPAARRGTGG